MTQNFDPYHKWLGIPPQEQPPNHYRLLALGLFESDPEVIDAAANRQMAYVQQRATGEHTALSQKLLNELSAARLCLLDAKKRAAYDAELKGKLGTASKETTGRQSSPVQPESLASQSTEPPANQEEVRTKTTGRSSTAGQRAETVPVSTQISSPLPKILVIAGGCGAVVLGVTLFVIFGSGKKADVDGGNAIISDRIIAAGGEASQNTSVAAGQESITAPDKGKGVAPQTAGEEKPEQAASVTNAEAKVEKETSSVANLPASPPTPEPERASEPNELSSAGTPNSSTGPTSKLPGHVEQPAESPESNTQPSPKPTVNLAIRNPTKTYHFTDEPTIKQNWKMFGDWRIEANGLRLNYTPDDRRTLLASEPPGAIRGNVTIEISCRMNVGCWVGIWELFGIPEQPGKATVIIKREGETISCSCNGAPPQIREIKEEQINQGGTLRMYTSRKKQDGWMRIESIRVTENKSSTRASVAATSKLSANSRLPSGAILVLTFDTNTLRRENDVLTEVTDQSGKGLVGQVKDALVVPGKVGNGLEFGDSRYVKIAGSFPTGKQPRTFVAWMKAAARHSRIAFMQGRDRPHEGFGIAAPMTWQFNDNTERLNTEARVDMEWHHHAVTYDGAEVRYYYDARVVLTVIKELQTAAGPLILGAGCSKGNNFTGVIDEVAVFDRALSPKEVERVYQLGVKDIPLAASEQANSRP